MCRWGVPLNSEGLSPFTLGIFPYIQYGTYSKCSLNIYPAHWNNSWEHFNQQVTHWIKSMYMQQMSEFFFLEAWLTDFNRLETNEGDFSLWRVCEWASVFVCTVKWNNYIHYTVCN